MITVPLSTRVRGSDSVPVSQRSREVPVSTTNTEPARRPGVVTFIAVLAYIAFSLEVLSGVIIVWNADSVDAQRTSGMSEDQLIVSGIVVIVIGVVGILLTGAFTRGSNIMRILFAILVAFKVAGGLYAVTALRGEERASGILPVVFGILILYLLFNRSSNEFFEGS